MRTPYTQFGCRKFKEWQILYMEAFNMNHRFHELQNMQTHTITSTFCCGKSVMKFGAVGHYIQSHIYTMHLQYAAI